jgi:PilZ domain
MKFITGITNDPTKMHQIDERRRFERRVTTIRVEIMHPSFGTIIGSTQDISDGGASVKIENHPLPPIGTEVKVRFVKMVGAINQEPVNMKVMHHLRNTIGLMFSR